jgi:hypothetical protein
VPVQGRQRSAKYVLVKQITSTRLRLTILQAAFAVSGKPKDMAPTISSGERAKRTREENRARKEKEEQERVEREWKERQDKEREKDKQKT